MMAKFRYSFLILYFIIVAKAVAQQTPIYSQYYTNRFLYNPAEAGENGTQASFLYRNQWVNIQESPITYAFTVDGKIRKEQIGLGLSFYSDENNIIKRTHLGISSAYKLRLAKEHFLSFGLRTQALQNQIDFDRVIAEDITDSGLLTGIDSKTTFELSTGLTYRWNKLRGGFAADQLLQNEISHEDAATFRTLDFTLVRHYIAHLSYDFTVNEKFTLEPILIARAVQGLSSQMDVSVMSKYKDLLWVGIGHRYQIGWAFSTGFTIQQQLKFGYTYELSSSDFNSIGGATHEIVLGWKFGKQLSINKVVSNLTAPSSNNAFLQEVDELRYHNEETTRQLEETREQLKAQQDEINQLRQQGGIYKEDINQLIESSLKKQEAPPTEETRYYVVVSAFKTLDYAKRSQALLKREKGLSTRVIQNETQSFYLVYTSEYNNLGIALQEVQKWEKSDLNQIIYGNPWVYVHDKK